MQFVDLQLRLWKVLINTYQNPSVFPCFFSVFSSNCIIYCKDIDVFRWNVWANYFFLKSPNLEFTSGKNFTSRNSAITRKIEISYLESDDTIYLHFFKKMINLDIVICGLHLHVNNEKTNKKNKICKKHCTNALNIMTKLLSFWGFSLYIYIYHAYCVKIYI